mgnify:CR=1 FL=1
MATITVNVDDDVYTRFRQLASEEKGGKKGFLGDAITESMQKSVEESEQTAAKKRLLELMRKGVRINYKGYKKRSELYEDRINKILSFGHQHSGTRD